ncbi:MAG: S8/S53 family peptidase [Candidatus Pacebacteria bacterium]|nr:S8/S53 family peptidase [Candidatus Paceibacterota bacterium]
MKNFGTFEYKQTQEMSISRFEDVQGKDLSKKNLAYVPIDVLQTIEFDTETIWPEKLPKNFDPEKLLEESKNPGLGIKELHDQGITGHGVVVAIIDQKLDMSHPEYKDSVSDYQEYGETQKEAISVHGPAVASLLVGKDCGVAPGAKLVYKAVPAGRNFLLEAEALSDIVQKNKTLPANEKVKIVSCSIGYMEEKPEPGLNEWIKALKVAKEAGVFVVDVGGNQIDIPFSGGGSHENKDNFENYFPWLRQNNGDEELDKLVTEGNIDEILKKLRETKKDELSSISDSDLKKKIEAHLEELRTGIIVPSDYRTMASSWSKEGNYMYNGKGGLSWSVPYLAGLFALALQVNPNLQREEIAEIIKESVVVNKKGLRIVNPKGIIDLAKESRERLNH